MKGGSGNNKLTFTNEKKGGVEKEVENSLFSIKMFYYLFFFVQILSFSFRF